MNDCIRCGQNKIPADRATCDPCREEIYRINPNGTSWRPPAVKNDLVIREGIVSGFRAQMHLLVENESVITENDRLRSLLGRFVHIFTPKQEGGLPATEPGWGRALDEVLADSRAALSTREGLSTEQEGK